MNQDIKILIGIGSVTLIVLLAAVFLLGKSGNNLQNPSNPPTVSSSILVRKDSHEVATPSAKVTLVEFGDYECPACDAAYPMVKQLQKDFQGKLNFVFRNFPLYPIPHKNAMIAAEAAESAGAQGKYWQMHDKLYENQGEWGESNDPMSFFLTYAKEINLNIDQFKSDVQANKFQGRINQDIADGNKAGVDSTPTFFINNVRYMGGLDYNSLKDAVQSAESK